jgi:hypothetical protein
MIKFVVGLLAISSLSITNVQAAECDDHEAFAAEVVTDYLDSWANVYLFFKQFQHCYDGSIAEGVQDKVQLLLADDWSMIPQMIVLAEDDVNFKEFVWGAITNESFPRERFARLVSHATDECPSVARDFCATVIVESKRDAGASK